jgi:hypothetical protein
MGLGLKALLDLSDLLGAELRIASGSARLIRRSDSGRRVNEFTVIPAWRGMSIELEAVLSREMLGR